MLAIMYGMASQARAIIVECCATTVLVCYQPKCVEMQAPGDGSVSQVGSKRPLDAGAGPSTEPQAKRQDASAPPETVLRLLIPHRKVSGLIGKHGSVIKQVHIATSSNI
jgi:hypothetical protein